MHRLEQVSRLSWWSPARVRAGSLAVVVAAAGTLGCGNWADKLACGEQGCSFTDAEWARVQGLANVGAKPALPDPSNKYLPIADKRGTLKPDAIHDPVVQLGWNLYYEPLLSGSASNQDSLGVYAPTSRRLVAGQVGLSCASCHDPRSGGSDLTSVPRHVSVGAGWYDVNAQQTLNAARYPVLYWNGRTDTLWAQAAQVMESAVSMNGYRMKTFWVIVTRYREKYQAGQFDAPPASDIDALAALLGPAPDLASTDSAELKTQYQKLLDLPADVVARFTLPPQEIVTRVHVNAAKAIAAYEWLLTSDGSPFDRYASEGPNSSALSPAAVRGLRLFIGKASCIDCHNTPLFSDGKFHNIGIPQIGDHVPTVAACKVAPCDCSNGSSGPSCLPAGAYAGHQKLVDPEAVKIDFYRGSIYDDGAPLSSVPDTTAPPARLLGAWRTPSLRDVAMTAPYMHDGSLATLSEVVWHYDQADSSGTLGTSELSPLTLSARDRDDLVAFLESLTGEPGPKEILGPPAAGESLDGGLAATPYDSGVDSP
jgi:cytochrome c peroxidase